MRASQLFRIVTWKHSESFGTLAFAISHPSDKNNDVARVGHPFTVREPTSQEQSSE